MLQSVDWRAWCKFISLFHFAVLYELHYHMITLGKVQSPAVPKARSCILVSTTRNTIVLRQDCSEHIQRHVIVHGRAGRPLSTAMINPEAILHGASKPRLLDG